MSWQTEPLGNLLAPSGNLRAQGQDLPVLSITMNRGLVDQSEKFKKRVASHDISSYRVVYRNELVVGFPIDEGVLGFQTKYPAAVVSPAYGIWKLTRPVETYIPFIENYLRSSEARSIYAAKMRGAVARRRSITKEDFLGIRIPFPTFDNQRRIVAILNKARTLCDRRQMSARLTDDLVQAIFIQMFVRNPSVENWKPRPIEWMAKEGKGTIRTGPFGSQLLHSEFVGAGIAVLGIDSAVKNRFEWGRPRFISPTKYQDLKRYKVLPGDLLVTIMGTLGRCAIVPDDIPDAINTKHLCCITLDRTKCIPEFLHACLLHHPVVIRQLGVRTQGAVMPGLNMGIIKELHLPLPPIELQEQFKRVTAARERVRPDLEESSKAMDNLFGALQQRAFTGELHLNRLILASSDDMPPAALPEKHTIKATPANAAAPMLLAPGA